MIKADQIKEEQKGFFKGRNQIVNQIAIKTIN